MKIKMIWPMPHWLVIASLALLLPLAGCTPGEQISTTLNIAFNALPRALQAGDLTAFNAYVATPQQGADVNGLRYLYQWIDAFQKAGTVPQDQALYELDSLEITSIQTRGDQASVHIRAGLSKIGAGSSPDVAIIVNQDIALQKINNRWLIVGADAAQVDTLSKTVR